MPSSIIEIASQFATAGQPIAASTILRGHINDTHLVVTAVGRKYVLQRINHAVFKDPRGLMNNVGLVTRHIKQALGDAANAEIERRVLEVIAANNGADVLETDHGEYWRMYRYVENSQTLDEAPGLPEIYQAGYAFGNFTATLADFPVGQLCETIPDFHHGPKRFTAFVDAVRRDAANRAASVKEEIAFIEQHESLLAFPQQQIDAGRLPLRVCHNDAKSSNILIDDQTRQALCVIDLDTVMPGLALYDFGDLARTTATLAAEDEPDLARVRVDATRLKAALEGYLAGTGNSLSPAERASLTLGPAYMTLVMATRFLTDHLAGDAYFKVHRVHHNLDRCRTQIAITKQLTSDDAALG